MNITITLPRRLNHSIEVVFNGKTYHVSGTSASTPIFAGLVALLNDARLKDRKPMLGCLNPFFYSSGYRAPHDFVAGGSYGCGGIDPQNDEPVNGSLVIPYAHWNVTRSWDPVTGLATPDFQKLKSMVLSF